MTLAEKILSLRTEKGLSQEDLAAKLEVSRQSVSKWETAQSIPDLDKIIKLADLFGVTVDDLVREEERPQRVYAGQKRKIPELLTVQKIGLVFEAAGIPFFIIGLIAEDWLLSYKAAFLIFLSLPLLLAKKRPWLTLCWVLMALSFVFVSPYRTAWGLLDGLRWLYIYIKHLDPGYSSYFSRHNSPLLIVHGMVGIVRGLLILALIVYTGYTCSRDWKKARKKDG